MAVIKLVFGLLIIYLDCTCTLGQLMLDQHKLLPGLALQDSLLWTDSSPRSLVRCVLNCRHTDRCYAVTVSTETSLCSYYDWWLDGQHPLIMGYAGVSGDSVILVKPIPAIFMSTGYTFDYSNAEPFCESIGARLMSLSELTDVWNLGYDRCGCGWVTDGNAYFPTTWTHDDCPHEVAVNHCNWDGVNSYDVYCTTD